MAKRMKEIEGKGKTKFLLIIVVFCLITIMIIFKDDIFKTINKISGEESGQTLQINEVIEEYIIEDFENFSFRNAKIKTENNISYITIDVINNSTEKSISRKIIIKLSGQNKEMQLAYTLPEIEANLSYEMQLSVIADLSDIELIEIKKEGSVPI